MRFSRFLALAGLLSGVAMSQPAPAAAPLAFEVATIKPSEPITGMGGKVMVRIGVRNDGAMVSYARMSLRALVQNAYGVKDYQVSGAPWMDTLQFDISAKLPDGASKDDAPEMLKTLLKERFKVSIHIEKKDHPIYALVVGKSGPKLKVAETNASEKSAATPREPGSAAPPPPPPPPSGGGRGGGTAVFAMSDGGGRGGPPSGGMSMRMDGSGGHIDGKEMTMTRFAETLSRFLDRPVIDQTAIEGSYDFKIDMSPEEMGNMMSQMKGIMMAGPAGGHGPGPAGAAPDGLPNAPEGGSIFQSIQQYGLKLEPKKAPMDIITIDNAEKTPSEN